MKTELIPLNGDPPLSITRDVTIVGRRDYCDVVVPHASLSKRHCVLVRTDGLLIIRDLISTNGTKVNGQRVAWAALMPDDRITLGRVKFRVFIGADTSPSPAGRFTLPGLAPTLLGSSFAPASSSDSNEFEAPSPQRFQAIRAQPAPPAIPYAPPIAKNKIVEPEPKFDFLIDLDDDD